MLISVCVTILITVVACTVNICFFSALLSSACVYVSPSVYIVIRLLAYMYLLQLLVGLWQTETRKRGNCERIATWVSPTPRQSLTTLITTPMPSLKSLNLSTNVLQCFHCSYVTLRCDLELWPHDVNLGPLTLNMYSRPDSPRSNSLPNLSAIEQSAAELCDLNILPDDLMYHMLRYALR